MNSDQAGGLIRTFLLAVAAYVAGKGWLPGGVANDIAGAVTMLIVAVWSWRTNGTTAMAASLIQKDEIKKIVATPDVADAVPDRNVTTTG